MLHLCLLATAIAFTITAAPAINATSVFQGGAQDNPQLQNALQYFQQGENYMREKRYADAIGSFRMAVQIWPNYPAAFFNLGMCHAYSGEYPLAISAYKQVLSLEPGNWTAYINMASIYSALKEYSNEIDALQSAIRIKPDEYLPHYRLGLAYRIIQRYTEAITSFKQAAQLNPKDVDTQIVLTLTYSDIGWYSNAIESARKAIQLNPGWAANGYNGIGWYYLLMDQPSAALEQLRESLRINAMSYMPHTNLARAYNDLGRYQEAIAECQEALQLKAGDAETLYYLGYAHKKLGHKTRALETFRAGVTSAKKYTNPSPDDYYILGNTYFQLGEYENAIRAYKQCLGMKQYFSHAHLGLGLVYYASGDTKSAMNEYEVLNRLDPAKAKTLLSVLKSK